MRSTDHIISYSLLAFLLFTASIIYLLFYLVKLYYFRILSQQFRENDTLFTQLRKYVNGLELVQYETIPENDNWVKCLLVWSSCETSFCTCSLNKSRYQLEFVWRSSKDTQTNRRTVQIQFFLLVNDIHVSFILEMCMFLYSNNCKTWKICKISD